ncbi:hypothetical protein EMCRGX_G022046 [Ephydatia muelleri]
MALCVLLCLLSLTTTTLGLGGTVCKSYTNVRVSDASSSNDTSSCLNGTYACKTLEYALRNVTNCTYISINCSGPLTVNAPINVANVYGLTLEAGVTNQKVLCSNGAGLRFQAVRDVQIVGLHWYQCSIRHPTFSSYGRAERSSGIVFIESANISLKRSAFTSSYGTGLSLYNVGGTVTIQNCSFTNNTVTGCIGPIRDDISRPVCNESSHGLHISSLDVTKTPVYITLVGLGTVYLESSTIVMSNTLFNQNIGTALFLSSSVVTLQGAVKFAYNYAINGAAVYLSGVSWMKFTRGLQLHFESNHALQYGGGVYQEFPLPGASGEGWNCIIQYENDSILMDNWNVTVSFVNNIAQRGGSSIYLSNPESCIREGDNPPFTNSLVYNFRGSNAAEQVSNPANMIHLNQTCKTVWEGQSLQLSAYAVDHFNHSATSPVLLELDYNRSSPDLSLGGNRAFQLNSASSNDFYVTGPLYNDSGNSTYTAELIAHSAQQPLTVARIVFNVSQCPFGCPYNATLKVCQCKSNSAVQCEDNVCCIKYGYWYGKFQTSDGSIAYEGDVCPRGFCSYNGNGLCPENGKCPFILGYCKLPEAENDICANNRGGAFCSYCTDGNSFTYAGIKCVDDSRCSYGYKTLLVFLIFLYWAILTGVILFALKFKFRVGSGRLYCVLYYFSIINYFVGNNYPTAFLQVSVDLISGIVLQPRFLGSIDLCLSKGMLPIEIVALNYIHPLFFLIFVFTIIFMAHYFRSIANLKSTSQAVCLLVLLSHTSLVETSITILRPVIYSNLDTEYVSIQPTTKYFDSIDHLPYAAIALFVLIINIPLSLLLFSAPWLSKCGFLKMDKIKPILDEFQGCYKDEYRCFAGFYLIVRELIYLISLFPNLKVYGAIYTYQWVSIIAVIIHAMVQPYKEKWLNILDTVLLSNLVAVSLLFGGTAYTLFGQNDDSRNFHVFLVHIFVLMPIIYAVVLGIYLLIIQVYEYVKQNKSVNLNGLTESQLKSSELNVRKEDRQLKKEMSEVRLPLNQSSENQFSGKARSTPPSLVSEGLASFDEEIRRYFSDCVAIDASESDWLQVQLSLSRGGLGLHRVSSSMLSLRNLQKSSIYRLGVLSKFMVAI